MCIINASFEVMMHWCRGARASAGAALTEKLKKKNLQNFCSNEWLQHVTSVCWMWPFQKLATISQPFKGWMVSSQNCPLACLSRIVQGTVKKILNLGNPWLMWWLIDLSPTAYVMHSMTVKTWSVVEIIFCFVFADLAHTYLLPGHLELWSFSFRMVEFCYRADSRFVPSQWETTLLCNLYFVIKIKSHIYMDQHMKGTTIMT